MKRLALQEIIEWQKDENRKPLVVWGARQVGKTYLIKKLFAEKYFPNRYIYIDCKIEDEISKFCETTANASKIIEYISLIKGKKIDQNTLVIFDEVQECLNILSALKYFCQDYPEIPVIATGSMVRMKLTRENHKRGVSKGKGFLFPVGKINQINIYPLSFEEFLMNSNPVLYKTLKTAYGERKTLDSSIHEIAIDAVYRYLLIGGMPEVLDSYIKNGDVLKAHKILNTLYDNYLSDMDLYQASPEAILKSRNVFKSIYTMLNRENKNFSPSIIKEKSKTRDYESAIQWLSFSNIINISYLLKEHVTMPLLPSGNSLFRLFLGDIGMFSYQSGINASSFISNNRENTLSGIFFENFVANEFTSKEIDLYYWKGKSNSEFEFIVESDNKLYPIDVKKTRGSLNSLNKFKEHNSFEWAIKISKNNYGFNKENKILTVPFYYVPFLADELSKGKSLS